MKRVFSKVHRENLAEANRLRGLRQYEQYSILGKLCKDCGQTKPLDDFYLKNKQGHLRVAFCKTCLARRFKQWVNDPENKEIVAKRQKKNHCSEKGQANRVLYLNRRRAVWYEVLISMGLDKCQTCGYDKNAAALELHHSDPSEKEFNIGSLLSKPFKEKYLDEVLKCICLCTTCHRALHNPLRNGTMVGYCLLHKEYLDKRQIRKNTTISTRGKVKL